MLDIQVGDLVKIKEHRLRRAEKRYLPPGVWLVLKIRSSKKKKTGEEPRQALIMKGNKRRRININKLEKV